MEEARQRELCLLHEQKEWEDAEGVRAGERDKVQKALMVQVERLEEAKEVLLEEAKVLEEALEAKDSEMHTLRQDVARVMAELTRAREGERDSKKRIDQLRHDLSHDFGAMQQKFAALEERNGLLVVSLSALELRIVKQHAMLALKTAAIAMYAWRMLTVQHRQRQPQAEALVAEKEGATHASACLSEALVHTKNSRLQLRSFMARSVSKSGNTSEDGSEVPVSSETSTLQHTATHCNTLQHTATYCNALQSTEVPVSSETSHRAGAAPTWDSSVSPHDLDPSMSEHTDAHTDWREDVSGEMTSHGIPSPRVERLMKDLKHKQQQVQVARRLASSAQHEAAEERRECNELLRHGIYFAACVAVLQCVAVLHYVARAAVLQYVIKAPCVLHAAHGGRGAALHT